MNKTLSKGIGIGILLIIISILMMYLGLAYYYREGFSYNTWINGVYCTGKTVEEVNAELKAESLYEGLTITTGDGKSYAVLPEDVSMRLDYVQSLNNFQKEQHPLLWIDNLIGKSGQKEISPRMTYDEAAFEALVKQFPFFTGLMPEERQVNLLKGAEGYYLQNERSHVLDESKAYETIRQAFESRETEVNLEDAGCYRDLPLSPEMEELLAHWERIEAFQTCGIVYQFGEELVPVGPGVTCEFMELDENGQIVFDENGDVVLSREHLEAFVDKLAEEYDTVGKGRYFQATRGETVFVEGGIYGNKLDCEAEKEYLYQAFQEKKQEVHEPQYLQKAKCQGKEDIGNTYIEVDMTEQKMYYYENGTLRLETDVVTGNTSLRRGTPEGTNYVYNKQMNRVLRGADYATPVKYWMPVYKAIGIHDASWRKTYGGEIYKTNGSHGCINTPMDKVAELYEIVEIGTPCIMFY